MWEPQIGDNGRDHGLSEGEIALSVRGVLVRTSYRRTALRMRCNLLLVVLCLCIICVLCVGSEKLSSKSRSPSKSKSSTSGSNKGKHSSAHKHLRDRHSQKVRYKDSSDESSSEYLGKHRKKDKTSHRIKEHTHGVRKNYTSSSFKHDEIHFGNNRTFAELTKSANGSKHSFGNFSTAIKSNINSSQSAYHDSFRSKDSLNSTGPTFPKVIKNQLLPGVTNSSLFKEGKHPRRNETHTQYGFLNNSSSQTIKNQLLPAVTNSSLFKEGRHPRRNESQYGFLNYSSSQPIKNPLLTHNSTNSSLFIEGILTANSTPPPYGWRYNNSSQPIKNTLMTINSTNSSLFKEGHKLTAINGTPIPYGWINSNSSHSSKQTQPQQVNSNSSYPTSHLMYPLSQNATKMQPSNGWFQPNASQVEKSNFHVNRTTAKPNYGWIEKSPQYPYNPNGFDSNYRKDFVSSSGKMMPISHFYGVAPERHLGSYQSTHPGAQPLMQTYPNIGWNVNRNQLTNLQTSQAFVSSHFVPPPQAVWGPSQVYSQAHYDNYDSGFIFKKKDKNKKKKFKLDLSLEDFSFENPELKVGLKEYLKDKGKDSFHGIKDFFLSKKIDKLPTRRLYSRKFPQVIQNLDLEFLSDKGNMPDFTKKSSVGSYVKPLGLKAFAGLEGIDNGSHFKRNKRELSAQGKAMAKVINNFLLHERDCNETLEAKRRRRQTDGIVITKRTESKKNHIDEPIIRNINFGDIEAVIQDQISVSVHGGITEIISEKPSKSNMLTGEDQGVVSLQDNILAKNTDENDRKSHLRNDNMRKKIPRVATRSQSETIFKDGKNFEQKSSKVVPLHSLMEKISGFNTTTLTRINETLSAFLKRRSLGTATVLNRVNETLYTWKMSAQKNKTAEIVGNLQNGTNNIFFALESSKRTVRSTIDLKNYSSLIPNELDNVLFSSPPIVRYDLNNSLMKDPLLSRSEVASPKPAASSSSLLSTYSELNGTNSEPVTTPIEHTEMINAYNGEVQGLNNLKSVGHINSSVLGSQFKGEHSDSFDIKNYAHNKTIVDIITQRVSTNDTDFPNESAHNLSAEYEYKDINNFTKPSVIKCDLDKSEGTTAANHYTLVGHDHIDKPGENSTENYYRQIEPQLLDKSGGNTTVKYYRQGGPESNDKSVENRTVNYHRQGGVENTDKSVESTTVNYQRQRGPKNTDESVGNTTVNYYRQEGPESNDKSVESTTVNYHRQGGAENIDKSVEYTTVNYYRHSGPENIDNLVENTAANYYSQEGPEHLHKSILPNHPTTDHSVVDITTEDYSDSEENQSSGEGVYTTSQSHRILINSIHEKLDANQHLIRPVGPLRPTAKPVIAFFVYPGEVLISAPRKKIVCPSGKRQIRGRCRDVWNG